MGTRSGDLDPAVVQYIAHKENLSLEEVIEILNKKSGVLGISGISSDFRDLIAKKQEGDERATLALDAFEYRVAKYIGSYITAMNGVDAIVFTAGVGENNGVVREKVMDYFGYLGIKLDKEKNLNCREEGIVSTADSSVKVCVIPTNEEIAIARETKALVEK